MIWWLPAVVLVTLVGSYVWHARADRRFHVQAYAALAAHLEVALDALDRRQQAFHDLSRALHAADAQREYRLLESRLDALQRQDLDQHQALMAWLNATSAVLEDFNARHGETHTFVKQIHANPASGRWPAHGPVK